MCTGWHYCTILHLGSTSVVVVVCKCHVQCHRWARTGDEALKTHVIITNVATCNIILCSRDTFDLKTVSATSKTGPVTKPFYLSSQNTIISRHFFIFKQVPPPPNTLYRRNISIIKWISGNRTDSSLEQEKISRKKKFKVCLNLSTFKHHMSIENWFRLHDAWCRLRSRLMLTLTADWSSNPVNVISWRPGYK